MLYFYIYKPPVGLYNEITNSRKVGEGHDTVYSHVRVASFVSGTGLCRLGVHQ